MNNNVTKYLPIVAAVLFFITIVSVWLTWLKLSFFEESVTTNLWDSEAGIRFVVLLFSVIGAVVSVSALKQKSASIGSAVIALIVMGASTLYVFAEKSDADELGLELTFGIGFLITILSMIGVIAVSVLNVVMNKKSK